jgi:hypothetical protein
LRTSGSAGSWICFVSLPRGRLLIVHSLVESLADAEGQPNSRIQPIGRRGAGFRSGDTLLERAVERKLARA